MRAIKSTNWKAGIVVDNIVVKSIIIMYSELSKEETKEYVESLIEVYVKPEDIDKAYVVIKEAE